MTITSLAVVDEPAVAGADEIAGAIGELLGERGRCTLALSRGDALFRHLATALDDWRAVDVFQVDERVAPDGTDERNLTSIEFELVANIAGAKPRFHAMPVTGDLNEGASAYARELEELCGAPPVIDVIHLGLGPDGHTASLVPADPVLEVADRWVAVTGSYQGYRRMTLTYPVLDAASVVVIVAAGTAKAKAVAAVQAGDASAPAGRIAAADIRIVTDAAAAAKL